MLSHHERTNMAISRSGLPKTVLELFDPRADLEYKAPLEPKKPALPLLGLAGYVGHFPTPDDPEYQPPRAEVAQAEERKFRSKEYHLQAAIEVPTIEERRAAAAENRKARHDLELEASIAAYDPKADPKPGSSDPMKTIFVSRLDYATGEPELRAEFARHGNIRSIALVKDKEGKSRGYAFIEYEHTGDMKAAYKAYPPEGFMKVGKSERWSLVDVERGRTVPDWRPMRLGGGKGGESRAPKAKKTKGPQAPGIAPPSMGPPGMAGPPGGPMSRYGGPPPRDDRRAGYPPRPDDRRSSGAPDSRSGYGGDRRDSRGPGGYDSRAPDRGGRYGGPPDDRANGSSRYGGGSSAPGPPGPSRDRYGDDGGRDRGHGGDRRRTDEDGGGYGRERSRDRDRDRRSAGYGSSDRRGDRGDDGGSYGAKRERDDRYGGGADRRAPDGGYGRPRDDRDAKRGRYDERGGGGRYDDRGGRDYRRG